MRRAQPLICLALAVLLSTALEAQTRVRWETAATIENGVRGQMLATVTTIDDARSRLTILPDGETTQLTAEVITDTVNTRYFGLGAEGEVSRGAAGFRALRLGDRIEVRGAGQSERTIRADEIVLVGRTTPPPTAATPGTTPGTAAPMPERFIEGIVRNVVAAEQRLVIETADRRLQAVFGSERTPVYFRGTTYAIRNIEVGDQIRVDVELGDDGALRARAIDVVSSVSHTPQTPRETTITAVTGRITRIDFRPPTVWMTTERGEPVRVDLSRAADPTGDTFPLTTLAVGDYLSVSGRFDSAESFRADAARRVAGFRDTAAETAAPSAVETAPAAEMLIVVLYGTLRIDLRESRTLTLTEEGGRTYTLWVDEDLVVRNRDGSYATATRLRTGDRVAVRAFRDEAGRHIAQTIRLR